MLGIPFMLICATGANPTTQPGFSQVFERMRQQRIDELIESQAALPDVGEKKLDELIHLSVVDGEIQILAKSSPTREPSRATLAGISGRACIDIRGQSDKPDDVSVLQVQVYDSSRPGELQRHTSLFASPYNLQLSQIIETPVLDTLIQFVQNRDEEEVSVLLSVQSDSQLSGDVTQSLVFRASSFVQLMEKYPRETHRYLGPIVRDLKLERAIFAPEPAIARKALGITDEIDHKLAERIETILPKLEASDFRTRELAMRDLKTIGKPAAGILSQMSRKEWSPARVAAVDSFLAEMEVPTAEESGQLSTSPDFLIRCLYIPDPAISTAAMKMLETQAGKPLKVNPNQDINAVIDRLYQTLIPPAKLDETD